MSRNSSTKTAELRQRRDAPLATPTDLTRAATKDIAGAMNAMKDENLFKEVFAPQVRIEIPVCSLTNHGDTKLKIIRRFK
jgi:hypothetical protein